MNRKYRRLAISSGAVAVSAALAATSWATALPQRNPVTVNQTDADRAVDELVLDLTGARFLGAESTADPDSTVVADPEDLTIDQVLLLLERAEQVANSAGEGFTEEAANAAVDLANLLDTYLAQQAANQTDGVTIKDVALAAVRLAKLLNPSGVSLMGDAVLASEVNTPLTTMLRDLVDQYGTSTNGFQNGKLPDSVLCALPFASGHRLRCDAAAAAVLLNNAFQARFGRAIPVTDSYRTLESQVRLSITKPTLAARPGTSQHGWGLALDLGSPISTGKSAEYYWLRENGPQFGWDNPTWARLTGSKPEPWHFEFFAGGSGGTSTGLSDAELAAYRATLAGSVAAPVQTDNQVVTEVNPEVSATLDPDSSYAPILPEDPNLTAVVPVEPITTDPATTDPTLSGSTASESTGSTALPDGTTSTAATDPTIVITPPPSVAVTTLPSDPQTQAPSVPDVAPTTDSTVPSTTAPSTPGEVLSTITTPSPTPTVVVPVEPTTPAAPTTPVPTVPRCVVLIQDKAAMLSTPKAELLELKCLDPQFGEMTLRAWAALAENLPLCTSANLPDSGLCVVDLVWQNDRWAVVTKEIAPVVLTVVGPDPTPEPDPEPIVETPIVDVSVSDVAGSDVAAAEVPVSTVADWDGASQ